MLVLVAIVKNEGRYLLEWIAYHRGIGVNHFIIMDNESTDGTFFLLRPLAEAGIITYFRWDTKLKYPGFESVDIGPQVPAYDFAFKVAREMGRWRWVGFIDLDEFIVLGRGDSIGDVLKGFEGHSAVGLSWRMFGSSGHVSAPPGLVIENFTQRASDDFPANTHVKSIVQIACLDQPGIHIPSRFRGDLIDTKGRPIEIARDGIHDEAIFQTIWINHYFTKSQEEWAIKKKRGRVSKHPLDSENQRAHEMFAEYDRNEEADVAILRFMSVAQAELEGLEVIIRTNSIDTLLSKYQERTNAI